MHGEGPDRREGLPARRDPAGPVRRRASDAYLLPDSGGAPQSSESEIDSLTGMFRRRRWWILGSAAAVLATAATITFLMPEKYQSESTILVKEARETQTDSALELLERVGENATIETEIQLLTSRRVVEPVVESLGLNVSIETADDERLDVDEVFTSLQSGRDVVPGRYRISPFGDGGVEVVNVDTGELALRREKAEERAALEFAGMTVELPRQRIGEELVLNITPFSSAVEATRTRIAASPIERDADLIRLTCEGSSPERAHDLCRSVSSSYLDMRRDLQQTQAAAAAVFLAEQVQKVGQQLREAESELQSYQESNRAIALDEQASSAVDRYSLLLAQREQLEAERAALTELVDQIESRGTEGFRDLASFPTFMRERSQTVSQLMETLVELENERAQLTVTRTERNPDVVAVDARIEEVKNQLKNFGTTYLSALGNQIQSLDSAVGRSRGQLTGIPTRQVESARLQRQVTLLEELYGFLQTRLQEAQVARSVDLPNIQIVDDPSIPVSPSQPNVPLNLALGLVLGLGFGLMIALYKEHTDSRIRERAGLEQEVGVPVLGMIPKVKRIAPILPVERVNGKELAALTPGSDGRRDENGHEKDLEKRVSPARRSARRMPNFSNEIALEAFRSLAADIRFEGDTLVDGSIRSIAVTSASRGEGKTFVACNLALASVNLGAESILIDADLRASGVGRFFGLKWGLPGLTDALTSGGLDPERHLQRVHVDGQQILEICPTGSHSVRNVGLLERHSPDIVALLARAEANHDLVILDTPPLNVITDAATIASRVDAVVVVVRGGVTDREALELTLERLDRARARVLGVVLNDVELPTFYTSYSQMYAEAE